MKRIFIGKSSRPSKTVEELFGKAKLLGLSCPLGRALYLANRHFNGDYKPWGGLSRALSSARNAMLGSDHRFADDDRALRSVQPETAKRWLAHWKKGGSLKSLKYSQEEWLKKKKADEQGPFRTTRKERRDSQAHLVTAHAVDAETHEGRNEAT